jgi:hypothetical protein
MFVRVTVYHSNPDDSPMYISDFTDRNGKVHVIHSLSPTQVSQSR